MTGAADRKGSLSTCLPQIVETRPARAAGQDVATLPPTLPATSMTTWQVKMPPILPPTAFDGRLANVDRNAMEATGRGLDRLRLADLKQNSNLHSEVAKLQLNDFFDDRGSFRFRRLGLTFAAKQRQPSIDTFGSTCEVSEVHQTRTTATSSAKAFFLATSAIDRDLDMCRKRSNDLLASVTSSDKLRVDDVNKRRLEVVFNEIPACEKYFPEGVVQSVLLPLEIPWEAQMKELRIAERMVANFSDKDWRVGGTMNWIFPRPEVLVLSEIVGLWVEAYRPGVPIFGMDRSTFCRLILDIGLVDQAKVPYYWAVSLFDSVAKPIRWCSAEASGSSTSQPLVPCSNTVNSWLLISVLDCLFRALFGLPRTGSVQAPRDLRRTFLLSLFDIAKYKLPAKVIEASGLKLDSIDRAITYGDELRCQTPRSGRSSPLGFSQKGSTDAGDSVPSSREAVQKVEAIAPAALIGYELLRSDMLKSLLIEPEVLHVVAQHQEIFKRLHGFYADDDRGIVGNMSFEAFRQFCVDFHLCPSLVSCHFLQSAYESTKCMEPAGLQNRNLSAEVKAKGRRILVEGLRTGELVQLFESMEAQKKSARAARHIPPKRRASRESKLPANLGRRNSSERLPVRRSSSKDSVTRASTASVTSSKVSLSPRHQKETKKQRPPSSSTSLEPPVAFLRDKKPGSANSRDKAACVQVEGPEPWSKVSTVAMQARSRTWKRKDALGVFGVNAFVETLFRVAFSYLSTYGNNSQITASGYIRAVWLVTYLRCVFQHLHRRLQEKQSGERSPRKDARLHEPLRRALQEIGPELWESQPMAELVPLLQTRMHALFPESLAADLEALQKKRRTLPDVPEESPRARRHSKRRCSSKLAKANLTEPISESEPTSPRDALQDDSELPCIKNGICSICKSHPGSTPWGNALCRGCSIVDRLSFKYHVFKKLLIDERTHYKLKARAEIPMYNAKRHAMTPPPMGIAHSLRKAPELS